MPAQLQPFGPIPPLSVVPNPRDPDQERYDDTTYTFELSEKALYDSLNGDFVPKANALIEVLNTELDDINTVVAVKDDITDVAENLEGIETVLANMSYVTTVSTNIADVTTCADNLSAILSAPASAERAETAAEKAEQIAGLNPSTTPVASGTPVADETGKIAAGWLPPVTPAAHHSSHEPGGSDAITTFSGTASGKFSGTVVEKSQALGTISGTKTIDLSAGLSVSATIGGATTLAFSNVPAGGAVVVVLRLTNAGSAAVTWPTTISWADSAAPTLTEAGTDMVVLMTDNGGANWWGNAALEFGTGA